MSLLARLGRGFQGFIGGGVSIGAKVLQQTLTSSGTYTANGRETTYVVIGGGGNGGQAGPTSPSPNSGGTGGRAGSITVGTSTISSPISYTIGGASGTTNFGPTVSATGGSNPTALGGSIPSKTGGSFSTPISIASTPTGNASSRNIVVGGGGYGGAGYYPHPGFLFVPGAAQAYEPYWTPTPQPANFFGASGGGPAPDSPITGQSPGVQGGAGGNGFYNATTIVGSGPPDWGYSGVGDNGQSGESGKRGSGGGGGGSNMSPGPAARPGGGAGGSGVIYIYYGNEI